MRRQTTTTRNKGTAAGRGQGDAYRHDTRGQPATAQSNPRHRGPDSRDCFGHVTRHGLLTAYRYHCVSCPTSADAPGSWLGAMATRCKVPTADRQPSSVLTVAFHIHPTTPHTVAPCSSSTGTLTLFSLTRPSLPWYVLSDRASRSLTRSLTRSHALPDPLHLSHRSLSHRDPLCRVYCARCRGVW